MCEGVGVGRSVTQGMVGGGAIVEVRVEHQGVTWDLDMGIWCTMGVHGLGVLMCDVEHKVAPVPC
jgi:hypothetical protein